MRDVYPMFGGAVESLDKSWRHPSDTRAHPHGPGWYRLHSHQGFVLCWHYRVKVD